MQIETCAGLVAALTLLAGCATNNIPRSDINRAEIAIEQAQAEEAGEYAPTQLREAEQKVEQARSAANQGDYTSAEQLAEEALASAQLAVAESQSLRVQRMVEESLRGDQRQELQPREGTR